MCHNSFKYFGYFAWISKQIGPIDALKKCFGNLVK